MHALAASLLASAVLGAGLVDAVVTAYAPVNGSCPSTPLVRVANGIGSKETAYIGSRKPLATTALKAFLAATGAKFPTFASVDMYPTVALLTSGGGLRSLLTGAGVHKAYDSREGNNYTTSGLYQAMTYEAGLSGGAWLLSSIAQNNWPTITTLQNELWTTAFSHSLFDPNGPGAPEAYTKITRDVGEKEAAGFPVSIVDPYGRLLGYQLLLGADGGVRKHWSHVPNLSSFKSHSAPFPIMTMLGIDTALGQCAPPPNATQYEASPYEFGSWDAGVNAFTQTKFLGSALSGGKPATPGQCVKHFDNTGFLFGTSSNIFPYLACATPISTTGAQLIALLESFLPAAAGNLTTDPELIYALYPNPFYKFAHASLLAKQKTLTLADGGLSNQNNPIWPFLHRPDVDVLVVNDNSADTANNYPNGTEIYTTYVQAQMQGVGSRMPVIPPVATFVAQGLNKRPTFFGCHSRRKGELAIAYIPNADYNYNSGTSTFMPSYTPMQSAAMIDNGALVGSNNNTAGFGTCMGCLFMKKSAQAAGKALPSQCRACFTQYCYN